MVANLRSRWPLVALIALAVCAGCRSTGSQVAETSSGMGVGGVPKQWEPPLDSDETAEISQTSAGERESGGKTGLTKWWRQKGTPKLPRIPLPRTDAPADDEGDSEIDDESEDAKSASETGTEPDFTL